MNKLIILCCLLLGLSCTNAQPPQVTAFTTTDPQPKKTDNPKHNVIQLALLLDVSNSMDGLIDQAKSELWSIVNEVSKASKNGHAAKLEIALYEYGRQSLTLKNGYARKLLDYTSDLDTISQVLFSLTTDGGEEYCGNVIRHSLDELKWQNNDSIYRVIFIAGNEPFNQGNTSYKTSCLAASEKRIIINTIHCGDSATGVVEMWRDGARTGKGDYFFIDQNIRYVEIATPYDDAISDYNDSINSTYIAYGASGMLYKDNQMRQDQNAMEMGTSSALKRTASKSNRAVYSNTKWDAVDASIADSTWITKAKDEELPTEMKGKTIVQKKAIIKQKEKSRTYYSKNIAQLSRDREKYLQNNKGANNERTLGAALISAIRKQAMAKGFEFIE
ncbi:MAG: hypothetical protein V4613_14125 [Bacteroidota bacterium]